MIKSVKIDEFIIGPNQPCFVIAEAGVNHNGDIDLAKRMIKVASKAGANAIKFQTYKAEQLVTHDAPKAAYQQKTTAETESQYEMLKKLELSSEAYHELVQYCRKQGILFMSTPFDKESADFLVQIGMKVFKIPSGEITNLQFLDHVGRIGSPVIISTGMAKLGEVEAAVNTIEGTGNQNFILLHCVSDYPAKPQDANLRAMKTLEKAFGVPVGFSDHTPGIEVSLAAVALGASIIEKHFTLDRTLPGPDHQASLEPDELRALVRGIRIVESALGSGRKKPITSEEETARVVRKSLVAATDIPAGTVLTDPLIAVRRPGSGLSPEKKKEIIGKRLKVALPAGTLLRLEMLE
jgi:N,N'-diacetyllegionaminate synthase